MNQNFGTTIFFTSLVSFLLGQSVDYSIAIISMCMKTLTGSCMEQATRSFVVCLKKMGLKFTIAKKNIKNQKRLKNSYNYRTRVCLYSKTFAKILQIIMLHYFMHLSPKLVEPYKIGVFFEKQMRFAVDSFFSEKFAGSSHTFTQKWEEQQKS